MVDLVLEDFRRALKGTLGNQLVAAALFGSRARGDATEESDWDLLVILRDDVISPWDILPTLRHACFAQAGVTPTFMLRSRIAFETQFPSVYLDIAEDARVFAGEDYLIPMLGRIRELTHTTGLQRVRDAHGFYWQWDRPPRGHWSLDWNGYRDVA